MFFGSLALIVAIGAVLLVMSLITSPGSAERIIFSLASTLFWMVCAYGAFSVQIGADVYNEWQISTLFFGLFFISLLIGAVSAFEMITERSKVKVEGE